MATSTSALNADAPAFAPGQYEHPVPSEAQQYAPPTQSPPPFSYAAESQQYPVFGAYPAMHSYHPVHGYYQDQAYAPWYPYPYGYVDPADPFAHQMREVQGVQDRYMGGPMHVYEGDAKYDGRCDGEARIRKAHKKKGKKGRKPRREKRGAEEQKVEAENGGEE